jgi:hypothetical protein
MSLQMVPIRIPHSWAVAVLVLALATASHAQRFGGGSVRYASGRNFGYGGAAAGQGGFVARGPNGGVVAGGGRAVVGRAYPRYGVTYTDTAWSTPPPAAPEPAATSSSYVTSLPEGTTVQVVNGTQYYFYNGLYYLPAQANGQTVYVQVTP